MKSLQKTLLIAGGTVIGIAVAGGMFAYQDGKIGAFSDDTVQAALEANDYSALSTEAQAQITEDQFADMEAHQASREAIQTAIANRDYEAFLAAADDRMLERIDSEEAFNELVTREAAQTTYQSALEAAVVANDYDAYIAAEDALHEAMQPSDEDKQARFQELVTYYEENGALPQGRGFGMGKGGMDGGFGPDGGQGMRGGPRADHGFGPHDDDTETNDDGPIDTTITATQ